MTSKQCDIYYPKSLKKGMDLFDLKPLIKITDVINNKHYLSPFF